MQSLPEIDTKLARAVHIIRLKGPSLQEIDTKAKRAVKMSRRGRHAKYCYNYC